MGEIVVIVLRAIMTLYGPAGLYIFTENIVYCFHYSMQFYSED